MAIRGLSFSEDEIYISRNDPDIVYVKDGKGQNTPTVDTDASIRNGATGFVLQNIPSGVMSRIVDMNQVLEQEFGSTKQRVVQQVAQKNREAFIYGIKDFINFKDGDDKVIHAEKEDVYEDGQVLHRLKREVLDRIHTGTISEVGNRIVNRNSMSEHALKNYEAQLSRLGASATSTAPNATEGSEQGSDTKENGPE